MKEKLFLLAALVILSSMTGVFFNMPLNVSAQEYKMNDERKDSYSYGNDEREYSSYDNYGYSDKSYGDESYGDESYGDESYGKKPYPMKDPKKFTCPSGIIVDKEANCPLVCPPGSDFAGHLVAAGSNLQLVCNDGDGVDAEVCPANTDLPGVLVENAPEDCEIFDVCPANTDLAGVLVQNAPEDCDIPDGGDGAFATCLKCADLATFTVNGEGPEEDVAQALIGDADDNVFTVCESEDVVDAFNDLIDEAFPANPGGQQPPEATQVKEAFDECISNAFGPQNGVAAQPTGQESALQETSPTTNVEPEAEIPTTSSPPAQQTGDLTAQQKSNQLMAQWMQNLIN